MGSCRLWTQIPDKTSKSFIVGSCVVGLPSAINASPHILFPALRDEACRIAPSHHVSR
jgi:hypothetical protein